MPVQAWVVGIISIILTIGSYVGLKNTEKNQAKKTFDVVALDYASRMHAQLNNEIDNLKHLRAFYHSSKFVDREEFRSFTRSLLVANPAIQALEWIPRVPAKDIDKWKEMAVQDGLSGFQFLQIDEQGKFSPISSNHKEDLYPVFYVEPYLGNEQVLGLNLASIAERLSALRAAQRMMEERATEPVDLVQTQGTEKGFLLFLPIDVSIKRSSKIDSGSFLLGVFRMDTLINTVMDEFASERIVLSIDDVTNLDNPLPMYQGAGWDERYQVEDFDREWQLNIAGRTWKLQIAPTNDYISQLSSSRAIWALLLGAAITLGLMWYIRSAFVRTRLVEEEVVMRTRELKEQAYRQEALLSSVPALVFFKNLDLHYQSVVDGIGKLTHMAPEDMVGMTDADCFPESYANISRTQDQQVLDTKTPSYRLEESLTDIHGNMRWLLTCRVPFKDDSGKTIGLVGTSFDITESKVLAEALEQEKRLFVAGPTVVFKWRAEAGWPVEYVSPNIEEHFGYTKKQLVHSTMLFSQLIHPADLQKVLGEVKSHQEQGRDSFQLEFRLLDAQGQERWVHVHMVVLRDHARLISHYHGYLLDISDRKEAESQLQLSEARLRNFYDAELVGMALMSPQRQWIDFNNTMAQMLGYTQAELQRKAWADMIHAEDSERDRDIYARMLSGDIDGETMDLAFVCKSGSIINTRTSVQCVRRRSNHAIDFLVVLVQDVTEHKHAEKAAQQARQAAEAASQAKGSFLAMMSHEIRTPMNGVLGMAELLQGTHLTVEQRDYVQTILQSGQSLLTIINDVLDFSKIEAGKLDLEPIPFDLERLLHDQMQLVRPKLNGRPLDLILDYAPAAPRWLKGDAGRIGQLVLNLLGNAVKFTKQGHVLLKVELIRDNSETACVRILVRDTGIGIAAEAQSHLFEPFNQEDVSTSRRYGGTGLGLAICKQLVELMGGSIGVNSLQGQGSTFWIELTLPVESTPEDQLPQSLNGMHLLLVEGHDINRNVFLGQLETMQVNAAWAKGVDQACAYLREHQGQADWPGMILISDTLADGSAAEFSRQLKKEYADKAPPLVMVNSHNNRSEMSGQQELYAACLFKPVLTDTLRQTLLQTMHRDSSLDEPSAAASLKPQDETCMQGLVLLAEDNKVNQKVAVAMLSRMGLTIELAANGQEALEMWRRENYELILMDCQMPVLDGYEATACIRKEERARAGHTPIIALTANAMASDREKCKNAGMDDFISKPVSKEQLITVLSRWLSQAEEEPAVEEPQYEAELQIEEAADAQPPLDDTVVNSLHETVGEVFADLVLVYLEETAELLQNLQNALNEDDLDAARRLAHSIKSSSANMGALRLSDMAHGLESVSDSKTGLPDASLMSGEFDRVAQALRELEARVKTA